MTRTQKCKNIAIITNIVKWLLVYGTALALVIIFLSRGRGGSENKETASKIKTLIYSIGLSLLPLIVISIIVKDKIQPTLWMLNVILSNYLLGNIAMYIIFALWLINEYIILPLNKKYKLKYKIRQEIEYGN